MNVLTIRYRLLRGALVITSLAIIVGTVVKSSQDIVLIRTLARTSPADVARIRFLSYGILGGATLAILIAVALAIASTRLRPPSSTRSMVSLLPKYGIRSLFILTAIVAIAVQFPVATLTATITIPFVTVLIAGAVALIVYPTVLVVKHLRGSDPS